MLKIICISYGIYLFSFVILFIFIYPSVENPKNCLTSEDGLFGSARYLLAILMFNWENSLFFYLCVIFMGLKI